MEDTNGDVNFSIIAFKTNEYQLQMARILIALIAGIVSGILRVEGILNGLGMYALWNVLGSATVIVYMGGVARASKHFPNGARDVFLYHIFSGIMTFILVWTVVYDVVHIF
jgi:hypothetical protein